MTKKERELCWKLVITPPTGRPEISRDKFLREFPSAVAQGKLALPLLERACREQSAEDLTCALIVGFAFGFTPEGSQVLRHLLGVGVDWHNSHEDIVEVLRSFHCTENIEALFSATQWIPSSLEYDEARALAVKAIWALGDLPGDAARRRLEELTRSDDSILRSNAVKQFERRE